jgi:site-specific DNA-methyltransferase (adenine-specific)
MNTKLMFSSKTSEYETPQKFFDELDREFHFELDVCATKENAKCERFYTKEDNAWKQEWASINWMNPPYGREIYTWVRKASMHAKKDKQTTVALLPARTDTRWFHDFIYNQCEIRFIKGRLKFGDSKNSAPFPSMVVVFRALEIQKGKTPINR